MTVRGATAAVADRMVKNGNDDCRSGKTGHGTHDTDSSDLIVIVTMTMVIVTIVMAILTMHMVILIVTTAMVIVAMVMR